jgi:spore germination cell wall hydrolase CwlJ-like protein
VLTAFAPAPDGSAGSAFAPLLTALPTARPDIELDRVQPGDHWWARRELPDSIHTAAEQRCLAEAVYFEARGESYLGQVAVAQVVLNRVKSPSFPTTVCDVVYQNSDQFNRCQFSFACDGLAETIHDWTAWSRATEIAEDISHGRVWVDDLGASTHYHALSVDPAWAGGFEKLMQIGDHLFYRSVNGGWT